MRSRAALLAPLVVASLALAGCTGMNQQPAGGETPDPVSEDALLVSLEEIDPGLAEQESIDAADQICEALAEGEDTEAVDELSLELFSDQAENEFGLEQAQQAVVVITTTYCP